MFTGFVSATLTAQLPSRQRDVNNIQKPEPRAKEKPGDGVCGAKISAQKSSRPLAICAEAESCISYMAGAMTAAGTRNLKLILNVEYRHLGLRGGCDLSMGNLGCWQEAQQCNSDRINQPENINVRNNKIFKNCIGVGVLGRATLPAH